MYFIKMKKQTKKEEETQKETANSAQEGRNCPRSKSLQWVQGTTISYCSRQALEGMSWSGEWGKNKTDRLYDSFDHIKNSTENCLRALSSEIAVEF